ncbi:bifunctional riboflavin biosynthesis protein RIBA 1 [Forsythia ovata]|uniref:Bifunctional riboflavin biosynthesis protein RIBA 1 n=1 Tax=Forsythia ovata TaxID=205694 RepID=A0ABD1RZ19_9LAMI
MRYIRGSKNSRLFDTLHCGNLYSVNGCPLQSFNRPSAKVGFTTKANGRVKLLFGEGGLLPNSSGKTFACNTLISDVSGGIEVQPDSVDFGILAADIVSKTSSFAIEDDEFDLDQPLEGFSSITEAIEDIHQGKMVVVVDDEDRENEGDIIMAASKVTPEAMAFFVKHGTGIVCDAKHSTTTGVSARDRATTILALASKESRPEDFNRPGHIFPLNYREGGVLKRAGHTEASMDLAMLAGLDPVGVLCEIVDDDGSMARLPKLRQFVQQENLKIISIADLIRYRRKRDRLVEHASAAQIPTMWRPFTAHCYRSIIDGIEHIAMVKSALRMSHWGYIWISKVRLWEPAGIRSHGGQQHLGRYYFSSDDDYSFDDDLKPNTQKGKQALRSRKNDSSDSSDEGPTYKTQKMKQPSRSKWHDSDVALSTKVQKRSIPGIGGMTLMMNIVLIMALNMRL